MSALGVYARPQSSRYAKPGNEMGLRTDQSERPGVYIRVTRAIVLTAAMLCLCAGLNAQEPQPASRPIAEAVDRIARELWPVEVDVTVDEQGRPRFRSGVTVDTLDLRAPWVEGDAGLYFRPRGGSVYHHETLFTLTPEAFRASTLYPIGFSFDPGATANSVKSVWRRWHEGRVRERIRKEAEALRAAASAPSP